MFDKLRNDDDRGQVGIGTLIVFIAMVLVAAIAAGVLINTAGFLQSSAEETGQQSSDQITNRLEVVNTVGNVDQSSGSVTSVELTVKKAPGAGNIDLSSTIAQMVHSSGSYDLIYSDSDSPSGKKFGVKSVQDAPDSDTSLTSTGSAVINDPADRAKITIQVDDSEIIGSNGLKEGDTATIQLNTQSGGTTTVRLVVPETLSGNSAVTL
ncbi:archaellin/type IV pilin N-terminal domain-containing protein [Haloarcula nitratireducens]|uniref:Flagellin n=1 Tax=Haloarcula nitratireducens TaxID=2487749 RepID=A0AAW4PCV6_9EURY|nr:archaellin/type IV pilin N-terminal domain-containing protein [Halomicroarcula nitratireducens]MBX0295510.1 flagellin [Halomicroarcula nitratireducens]